MCICIYVSVYMYICTQFILVTHMPMKLKRKKSDGRLQNEKTIRQVVMRFDKKKKKERNKNNKDPHRTYVLLGEDRW